LCLPKVGEGLFEVGDVVFLVFAHYNDVINIGNNVSLELRIQDFFGHSGKGCPHIFKPLQHSGVTVSAEGCGKAYFFIIFFLEPNLVVP
jgi:hypothetical protein